VKSFYLMLATVAIMVLFGLTLAASAVVKYIRYDPSAKPGSAISEEITQPDVRSAFAGSNSDVAQPGAVADTHVTAKNSDTPAEIEILPALESATRDSDDEGSSTSNQSLQVRLDGGN
jgi:hypothetical protein